MLKVEATRVAGLKILTPKVFADNRGSFAETYNRDRFAEHGITVDFPQDNHSWSPQPGTVRGLHFQSPPKAQAKLVRVVQGRIQDVAVDIRRSSPTYGQWVSEELSAENGKQLMIPAGFAHGFCALEPNCVVLYKVSDTYSPAHDLGIAWNDPDLAIEWKISGKPIISEKDGKLPAFRDLPKYFD